MKRQWIVTISGMLALLLVLPVCLAQGEMGTAFTYQGQLKDGGIPADEDYDFLFRLFEAKTGGAQVGDDVQIEDWPVPDGLFTVQLDFGAGIFTGDALWLEVGVRLGESGDPHTVLSPRQPLNATPYALYALSGPGSGGFWEANADDIYNTNSGQVGIGTTSPIYPLHVVSADADAVFGESSVSGGVGVYGKASSFEGGGFGVRGDTYGTTGFGVFGIAAMTTGNNYGVYGQSQSQTGRGVYGLANNAAGVNYGVYGVTNSPDGWAGYFSGRSYFGGDVGIGTQSPAEALDVDGTVKTTGFQLTTSPADGYVLTSDAAGVGSWQPSGGGDSLWLTSGDDIYYDGGNVGIGTATPDFGVLDVGGVAAMDVLGTGAGWIGTRGPNGNLNAHLTHLENYPNNGYVSAKNSSGVTRAGMYINTGGLGEIYADVKNFRVPNPNQRGTDIWYACVEGPEAAAYIRGTAHLVNGRATVAFPDHFTAIATAQGMTVQITPHSAESKGLAVVERSIEGFVVRELFSGAGTYDFDYTVMAVRQGYEDYRVIRPDTEGLPAGEIEDGDADGIADTEVR
ncbi:MAG: hypothetical protein ABIG44_03345 [Planctomycetota bacterium]